MPAGVTWARYLSFTAAAMVSMFAGAQSVHLVYHPLDDMEIWLEKEKEKVKINKEKAKI